MTLFLASVRSADEAEIALASGADIIDLKEPRGGALGALDLGTIKACVNRIAGRAPVSATIGDLPLQGDTVCHAVREAVGAGVDYVKLGLFPGSHAPSCQNRLAEEAQTIPLILVVFADAWPEFDPVAEAARIGAQGMMLDTAGKDSGSLLDYLSCDRLAAFILAAKAEGLSIGLAGALRAPHVPDLLSLKPDLLGFRGALCADGTRAAPLDPVACAAIRALIPRGPERSIKSGLAA